MPRAAIPIRPAAAPVVPPGPAGAADGRWRAHHLLRAPHRLGFALANGVLLLASGWWAFVQAGRVAAPLQLPLRVSPTTLHAGVMVFGFIPLFFAGFLFTAVPKWLGVAPLPASRLLVPLLAQAAGWVLWLAGGHLAPGLTMAGGLLAMAGLALMVWRYAGLVRASRADDRLHARVIAWAGAVGLASLGALWLGLALGVDGLARAALHTGLWGFVVVTCVTVAHRMIPFFTSSALPLGAVWRPFWVLWVLLGTAAFEVLAVWVETAGLPAGAVTGGWMGLRAAVELLAGAVVLWLAVAWGLVQSLRIRLLGMLHLGFVWLGLALGLGAASQLLGLVAGKPVLGLAMLHALAMGCLGSLLLAMVTRVSCGHSGRALVADRLVWSLFWLLQLATVLRVAGALPGAPAWAVPLAAGLWALVMAVWGLRLLGWYGRPRVDGRAG